MHDPGTIYQAALTILGAFTLIRWLYRGLYYISTLEATSNE